LLEIQPADRIVLVSSDTAKGKLCADLLCDVLKSHVLGFGTQDVEVSSLPGVETRKGDTFVENGLPAYMSIIARERLRTTMDEHGNQTTHHFDRLLFNVTGGYKGVIPFAVIAAQLLGTHDRDPVPTDVVYVHEEGQNPIALAPLLPIDWNELRGVFEDICTLVECHDTDEARALDAQRLKHYRDPSDPGKPGTLAQVVYCLSTELQWF
jgi:putative CRISPR-associated protein (TIGR02619 family)